MTTFFETGLGVLAYLVYVKIIPLLKRKAILMSVPQGFLISNRLVRLIVGPTVHKVPNRWWVRLLFVRGLAFVTIMTVTLEVFLSVGWRDPFSTVSISGLPSMPGWFYDLAFARSNNQLNGAHLVSYIGIPILGLYSMWKFKDEFMGPLVGAFFVAIHEGVWEPFYYLGYSQYLTWAEITNVLKDVSFASMIILFIVAFWKYPGRKIAMSEFKVPAIIYIAMVAGWFSVPSFFGYGIFPITTINNYEYGKGVYSETQFWGDPMVNLIEVFSWFSLFLMLQYTLMRWKPAHP